MPPSRDAVRAAIDRWLDQGLVSKELAATLRSEVDDATARERTRWSQYIVAATGAVVLLNASAAFVAWAWPTIELPGRVGILLAAGIVVGLMGMWLENRDRWVPASYLMQTAGLGILLFAVAYSERAWPDATLGAAVVGVVGLTVPLATAWLSIRRNPVMPAVHAATGYAFLGLFLTRLGMGADEVLWVLDAVLLVSVGVLVTRVRREDDAGSDWALNAFVASLYAGLVLVLLTSLGPLDLGDGASIAVDLWWLLIVMLTLWGIHRAPPALQRSWYDRQLGFAVLLGIPLAFWTAQELLELSEEATAGAIGAYGVIWLWYGLPRMSRPTVVTACLALVSGAWLLGVEAGGALGAVLALAFTGALLFWVSARLGRGDGDG